MYKKPQEMALTMVSWLLLFSALYDTFLKAFLDDIGFYRLFVKIFHPEATYYGLEYGFLTIRLIPLSIILLGISLLMRKSKGVKHILPVQMVTIVFELFILAIAIKNNL